MGTVLLRPEISYTPHISRRRPWRVTKTMVYKSDVPWPGHQIVVPTGYRTDLASVPRVPGIYWRYGNTAIVPAVLHDYLYEVNPHNFSRKTADRIFLEAMAAEKDPPSAASRWIMYMAVRLGGWSGWNRYRKAEEGRSA